MTSFDTTACLMLFAAVMIGAAFSAAVYEAVLDAARDKDKENRKNHERYLMAAKSACDLKGTYGKLGPIDTINYPPPRGPVNNLPINTGEPQMTRARHEFRSVPEARAFYSKSRANRATRENYLKCATAIGARLAAHSRFYVGDTSLA